MAKLTAKEIRRVRREINKLLFEGLVARPLALMVWATIAWWLFGEVAL